MSRQTYQTLFAYSWATAQRLLGKAALLDEAELHANPGYGHGSIYDLFFHLLNVSHKRGRLSPLLRLTIFATCAYGDLS